MPSTCFEMSAQRDKAPPDPRRAALMARVRAKNTLPEIVVRRTVHALGYRFRLHLRELPGSPDLVFPRLRKVIQVHGCFWHRHQGCPKATTPKTRAKFWSAKFEANIKRDTRTEHELRQLGWDVLVIWECQTQEMPSLRIKLKHFLGP
jgi:DNA mismatch endonuclease (patch repair protein)